MKRLIAVALLLGGCATPEQRAEQMIARHAPVCEKLGFTKDTDPWRQCILQQDAETSAASRAAAAAVRAATPRPITCVNTGFQTLCQ